MSFILFIAVGLLIINLGQKIGINDVDDSTWICLAILSVAEAISWMIWR